MSLKPRLYLILLCTFVPQIGKLNSFSSFIFLSINHLLLYLHLCTTQPSVNTLMGYVKIAYTTVFIRTSFSLAIKNYSCHPSTFVLTLYFMQANTFFLFQLIIHGSSRDIESKMIGSMHLEEILQIREHIQIYTYGDQQGRLLEIHFLT